MNTTSRQRILQIIRKYKVITTSEIHTLLDMTSANIRHHISSLRTDGLIEVVGTRKVGKGRPKKVYSLCDSISEDGLARIINSITSFWRKSLDQQELQSNFNQIGIKWAEEKKDSRSRNLSQALTYAIEQLNSLSYQAQWEAGREGPLVRFDNCPYKRIIKECPELCGMDLTLLGELVGLPFTQVAKLEIDEVGLKHCIFISS